MLISYSDLSVRSKNALERAGYESIEDIIQLKETDLRKVRNLGEKSIKEILSLESPQKSVSNSYNLNGLDFNTIKRKNVEVLEIDNTINKILKNNNVQTTEVFLELKKDDIKKFRGINKTQTDELVSIISSIRNDLNLNYRNIDRLIFSNPQQQIKETIINSLPFKDIESIQVYFRNEKKLKKGIKINCSEAKDSDIKKISDLSLDDIDEFINITPKELERTKGMNVKIVERILKVLLNKLVVSYENDIVIEKLAYNYLRNHQYDFWLYIEDDTLLFITQKINEIINKYVDTSCNGFKELMYFISQHTKINQEIENLEFNTSEINEIVYSYLKSYSSKLNYASLEMNFRNINKKADFREAVNTLRDEGLVILDGLKIITLNKSILHYAKRFKSERQYLALRLRLKDHTLKEIGDELELTRERARQLINQALLNLPNNVQENENAYWFKTYNLDQFMYQYLFEDNAFNYLVLKYPEGEENWAAILNDEMADDNLKRKVTSKIQENRIILDELSIPKKRLSILRHIIRNYCADITTHKELEELYLLFLDEYVSDKKGLELENRYVEARIGDQNIVVERPKKRFRFYDYKEYDWEKFYKELGLIEWKDMDLSTEIIFNSNEELMKEYNILNKYELHNIMKRTQEHIKNIYLKFGRTPHLVVGDGNREEQVKNLLFENSPIKKDDLAELYYQMYGVNKGSVLANYFDVINAYQVNESYVAKDIEIDEDILDKLIENVDNKSLVFLEDIQKVINLETSLVTLYLNQLGFKKYTNYYISDSYRSVAELYEHEIFNKHEIIDVHKIDLRIWSLSSFNSQIFKKIYSMDIVEFDIHKFITMKKLNDIGLSKEIFREFRNEVIELLKDNEFWSLTNILEVINMEEIDGFGFNDIFYRSLLRGANNLYNQRISNNYLFKLNEPVSLKSFLLHIVNKKKIIDIYDLLIDINEKYKLIIEKHKVIEIIKNLGMYYDEIMEKIYFDIDYYYEEFL